MIKFHATVYDTVLEREVQATCFAASMRDALMWFTVKYASEPSNLYAAEAPIDYATTPLVAFTAAVTGAGGVVYPASGNVIPGSRVVISPVPDTGFHLARILVDGTEVTPVDVNTVVVEAACAITVEFAVD